jgi:hypothetical protein
VVILVEIGYLQQREGAETRIKGQKIKRKKEM